MSRESWSCKKKEGRLQRRRVNQQRRATKVLMETCKRRWSGWVYSCLEATDFCMYYVHSMTNYESLLLSAFMFETILECRSWDFSLACIMPVHVPKVPSIETNIEFRWLVWAAYCRGWCKDCWADAYWWHLVPMMIPKFNVPYTNDFATVAWNMAWVVEWSVNCCNYLA